MQIARALYRVFALQPLAICFSGIVIYNLAVAVALIFANTKAFLIAGTLLPLASSLLFVRVCYRITARWRDRPLWPEWILLAGLWTISPLLSVFPLAMLSTDAGRELNELVLLVLRLYKYYPMPVITVAGYSGSLWGLLFLSVALPIYGHFCRKQNWR